MRNTARKTQESHSRQHRAGHTLPGTDSKHLGLQSALYLPCTQLQGPWSWMCLTCKSLVHDTSVFTLLMKLGLLTFGFGETEAWSCCVTVLASLCCCNETPEEIYVGSWFLDGTPLSLGSVALGPCVPGAGASKEESCLAQSSQEAEKDRRQACQCVPLVPALWKQKQEDPWASLGSGTV